MSKSTNSTLPSLTQREMEVLIICLKSLTNPGGLKIDAQKVAADANFGNAASAQAKWNKIRSKLFGGNVNPNEECQPKSSSSNGGAKGPQGKKTSEAPASKKRKISSDTEGKSKGKRARKGDSTATCQGKVWGNADPDTEDADEEPTVKDEAASGDEVDAELDDIKTEF